MTPALKSNTEWLQSLPRTNGKPGVEGMRQLLAKLGDPQNYLDFVHVAGTNGKGTVSTLTANILKEAGYKTGLTISPYVLDFRERMQINGEMIPSDVLEDVAGQVRAAAETLDEEPVQFTAVTAAALLWFYQEQCDLAVLEAGVGGKNDASNGVDNTLVAAITRIDLDHTEVLGDTLEAIAKEKAGIIKPGCTVVCYPLQAPEAQQAIVAECIRQKAELVQPQPEDLNLPEQSEPLTNPFSYGGYEVELPFLGAHQSCNAAMAVEIALALWRKGYEISDEAILKGLETARFPARIEVLRQEPLVILDGCHNPAGAKALAGVLRTHTKKKPAAVLGVLADKAAAQILEALAPCFDTIYTVTPPCPRAMEAQELAELARTAAPKGKVTACADLNQALDQALAHPNGAVVCGSLYLAAQARPELLKLLS